MAVPTTQGSTQACPTENTVAAFFARELAPAGEREIRAHWLTCPACRSLLDVMARSSVPASVGSSSHPPAERPAGSTESGETDRYEIRRPLGAGGMGIVFEAYDRKLRRRVALKVLSRAEAPSILQERLVLEARAMARVAHRNIVTVFDVSVKGGEVFVTMELLDGGTLADWVRERPRTWRETLAKLMDAGRGLAAAHAAGIIHRDFKPANVLVGADGEARVTDFGLAADASAPGLLAGTGGTPAYMAPEQLAGQRVDARADIFGFAVALYELLYGERPFEGRDARELQAAIAESRIRPAPRASRVPSAVRRALLRGLSPRPEDRHPTMNAFLEELDGARGASGRTRRWLGGVGGVSAIAVVTALMATTWWSRHPEPSAARTAAADPKGPRRVVAVLPFESSGGDAVSWRAAALEDLVRVGLSSTDVMRLAGEEQLAQAVSDYAALPAARRSGGAPELAAWVKEITGADILVHGSVSSAPDARLRVTIRVVDARTHKDLATAKEELAPAELTIAGTRLAQTLRHALGARPLGGEEMATTRATLPTDPEAAQLYLAARADLGRYAFFAARAKLELLVKKTPEFGPGHALLGEVALRLGDNHTARRALESAIASPALTSPEERLLMEARHGFATGNIEHAVERMRALVAFHPDHVGYLLLLARAEASLGQPAASLATVARARAAAASDVERARVDLREAATYAKSWDALRSLQAARRCLETAERHGVRELRMEALARIGWALLRQADVRAGEEAYAGALALAQELGDTNFVAEQRRQRGVRFLDRGELPLAREDFDEALRAFRSLESTYGIGNAVNGLAQVEARSGRLAKALALYDEAEGAYRDAGDREGVANVVYNRADAARDAGDLVAARDGFARAAKLLRDQGIEVNAVLAEAEVGEAMRLAGDLAAGSRAVETALTRLDAKNAGENRAAVLWFLGKALADAGDARAATARLDEAIELAAKHGAELLRLNAQLARVSTTPPEESRDTPGEALALADQARRLGAPVLQALAASFAARALGQRGRWDEAQRAAADAQALGVEEPLAVRVLLGIALAQLEAHRGDAKGARDRLAALEADARRRGALPFALECALERAAILGRGDADGASGAAIRLEARRLGLFRLTRRPLGQASSAQPAR